MHQSVTQSSIPKWRSFIQKLVQVRNPSKDIERRYQQELLANLTIFLLLFQMLSLPLFAFHVFGGDALPNYLSSTLLFFIIYFANRRGYYLVAAHILVVGTFLTIHIMLFTSVAILMFYGALLFLVSGIFLSLRTTIYMMVASIVVQLLAVVLDPQEFTLGRVDVLTFILFSIPVILVFIWHRAQVEKARQNEMRQVLQELRQSEARWRSLVANSPDLIVELDLDYKITFINRVANETERNQVVGHKITDFIYPEYHDAMFAGFKECVENNLIGEFDGKNTNLAGDEIWFSARTSPIMRDNKPAGFIISSRDMTEHRAAERALSYFQGRQIEFQEYLTSLHDIRAQLAACDNLTEFYKKAVILGKQALQFDRIAIFLIDEKRQFVQGAYGTDEHGNLREESDYTSPLAEDVWGKVISADESVILWHDTELTDYGQVVGHGWKGLTGLWDGKKAIGFLVVDNLLTHYVTRSYEEELIAIYASILAQTILHKRAEEQRINLAVQTEKIQLLEELISDLSHDIRTPLTSIHNYLYLLKKHSDPANYERHLNALEHQIGHLTQLVEDILAMARLDKNRDFYIEPVSINGFIEMVLQNYRPIAEKRHIKLEFKCENNVSTIPANSTELSRALANLIENAINYTPDGGEIDLNTSIKDNQFIIAITDTGIGIAEEDLDQIFDRFYRADKARNTIKGGTGLGLAIVKRVIELHHGELTVQSTLGQGSTFTIKLPLKTTAS